MVELFSGFDRAWHVILLTIESEDPLTTTQPRRTRRNLTEQQKIELARLYSETTTPLPEIKLRLA